MKKLVVFAGPPCTGKSTIGRALGYAHLEMDAARVALLPDSPHTRDDRKIAYRAVLWAAAHLLRYTDIVICNGGYGHAEDREACVRLAVETGARLYVAEFYAPLPVLLERNRQRRGHHPGLDLTDERVRELTETYVPWNAGIQVNGEHPVEQCTEAVRAYVEAAL
ncbi:MAG TPA: AAA family ATPase [Bryobacteraceae bacterium]|nr:AAA family ATPase [Bryobacteraceae bacterium]